MQKAACTDFRYEGAVAAAPASSATKPRWKARSEARCNTLSRTRSRSGRARSASSMTATASRQAARTAASRWVAKRGAVPGEPDREQMDERIVRLAGKLLGPGAVARVRRPSADARERPVEIGLGGALGQFQAVKDCGDQGKGVVRQRSQRAPEAREAHRLGRAVVPGRRAPSGVERQRAEIGARHQHGDAGDALHPGTGRDEGLVREPKKRVDSDEVLERPKRRDAPAHPAHSRLGPCPTPRHQSGGRLSPGGRSRPHDGRPGATTAASVMSRPPG